ncbi:MAG: Holliday junction branch migration protein RuvA [Candidatus Omnitrophica bacterium]|nr:Holliday junction branch migration protein RuvA [Candidatus Omnitrophota bacterium]
MISRIKGKLIKKDENRLLIDVNGIGYEVLVPFKVLNDLKNKKIDDEVELLTFHYVANDPARDVPMLIGFTNQIEKEFFEKFITVSGVGPKLTIKAFAEPISNIIKAIESADVSYLKGLPGIGEQKAKQIVAKLQGKLGRFGLIQDSFRPGDIILKKDIEEEAIAILSQLQYKKTEAERMVKRALEKNQGIVTTQELLNEVYNQRRSNDA